jgi:hypothetical protein
VGGCLPTNESGLPWQVIAGAVRSVRLKPFVCLFIAVCLFLGGDGACRGSEGGAPVAVFLGLSVYGGEAPRVEAGGKIAECEGDLLEFLAVETGGRAYESLLTLECKPSALQAALLLLGCKPSEKAGTRLSLEVSWEIEGRSRTASVGELLLERRTGKPPGPLTWVFTGSRFVKLPGASDEVFLADAEEAFISLYPHEGLLIQLGGSFGNPYRSPEAGFGPNTARLPPKGTPVKLVLRACR